MSRFSVATLLALALCMLAPDAHAQSYEEAGFRNASDLLPAERLEGPYHRVDEEVFNDGALNTYRIQSDFGAFEVRGNDLLAVRLHEIGAIAQLKEESSLEVIYDATEEQVVALVRSPFQLVRRGVGIVSNPGEAQALIESVPGGVEAAAGTVSRVAGQTVEVAGEVASSTGTAVAGAFDGESCDPELDETCRTLEQNVDEAAAFSSSAARRYSGHDRATLEVMQSLSIDPYTDNQILLDEVDRVAWAQTAVRTGWRFVPNPYGQIYGAVSQGVGYYDTLASVALYEDPVVRRQREAAEIASWGGVDVDTVAAFQNNPAYTPTTQSLLVAALEGIELVEARRGLFGLAIYAENAENVRALVRVAAYIGGLEGADDPMAAFIADRAVPMVRTQSGLIIVPVVADHLLWTRGVAGSFDNLDGLLDELDARGASLHVSGTASARFRAESAARAVSLVEEAGF